MRILISNDDGVHAPGIQALYDEFSKIAKVVVVAPERERSTTGHSLTLHKPLRLHSIKKNFYSVSGGPADCIYLGFQEVLKGKWPDLVISGINRGANMGQDVFYSGTVSAARESANLGVPSVAVSLCLPPHRPGKAQHYGAAASSVRKVLETVLPQFAKSKEFSWKSKVKNWPAGMLLNVNVPNLPLTKIKGMRASTQGFRQYESEILRRTDSRGRDYFWIGGTYKGFSPIPESDCWNVDKGFIAVTPLELDTTMKDVFHFLKDSFKVNKI